MRKLIPVTCTLKNGCLLWVSNLIPGKGTFSWACMKCVSRQVGTALVRAMRCTWRWFPRGWGNPAVKAVVWSSVLVPGWDVWREQGCAILPDTAEIKNSVFTQFILCKYKYIKSFFELMTQHQCELKCTDKTEMSN